MELWGQSFPGRGNKRLGRSDGEGCGLRVRGPHGSDTGRTIDNVVRQRETGSLSFKVFEPVENFLPPGLRNTCWQNCRNS